MYLREADLWSLLARLAGLAPGSRLVFDSIVPAPLRDAAGRAYAEAIIASVGGGEPWNATPHPDELADWLAGAGWRQARSTAEADWVPEAFWAANPQVGRTGLTRLVEAVRG